MSDIAIATALAIASIAIIAISIAKVVGYLWRRRAYRAAIKQIKESGTIDMKALSKVPVTYVSFEDLQNQLQNK
jgi:hypothetical protein